MCGARLLLFLAMADELVEAAQHGNVEKLKVFFKKGEVFAAQ